MDFVGLHRFGFFLVGPAAASHRAVKRSNPQLFMPGLMCRGDDIGGLCFRGTLRLSCGSGLGAAMGFK
jgi:hypothetical protein